MNREQGEMMYQQHLRDQGIKDTEQAREEYERLREKLICYDCGHTFDECICEFPF